MGRELGDPYLIASSLTGLAIIARDAGNESLARAHHEEALSLHRAARNPQGIAQSLIALGSLSLDAGATEPARTCFVESLEIGRDLGFRETVAAGLAGLAELAAVDGQPDRALRLGGAADTVRNSNGLVMTPAEHARHERLMQPAHLALGEAAAAAAWEEGRAMSLDEAIEYALATVPVEPEPADRRPAQDGSRLTPREIEVAALIAQGLTNQQIADQLVIAKRTAANHVEHILAKLGFRSRAQVAGWISEHGTSDVLTSGRSTK